MSRRLACLTFLCLVLAPLQGCFWGLCGATVEIVNETDDTIFAQSTGGAVSTDWDIFNQRGIDPGDRIMFTYSEFTFNPDVDVEYRGRHHTYHTGLDFLGFDRIYVHIQDFQFPHQ